MNSLYRVDWTGDGAIALTISYSVFHISGSNHQIESGKVQYLLIRNGGTVVCTNTTLHSNHNLASGTLSVVWDFNYNTSTLTAIRMTTTSSYGGNGFTNCILEGLGDTASNCAVARFNL